MPQKKSYPARLLQTESVAVKREETSTEEDEHVEMMDIYASDLLITLLEEHTEKLRNACITVEKITLIPSLTLIFIGLCISLPLLLTLTLRPAGTSQFTTFLPVFLLLLGLSSLVSWWQRAARKSCQVDLVKLRVTLLVKLIRRASQVEQHGRIDEETKLALVLKLSEAEEAIRYANRFVPQSRSSVN